MAVKCCERCGGLFIRDVDGAVCINCGRRPSSAPPEWILAESEDLRLGERRRPRRRGPQTGAVKL